MLISSVKPRPEVTRAQNYHWYTELTYNMIPSLLNTHAHTRTNGEKTERKKSVPSTCLGFAWKYFSPSLPKKKVGEETAKKEMKKMLTTVGGSIYSFDFCICLKLPMMKNFLKVSSSSLVFIRIKMMCIFFFAYLFSKHFTASVYYLLNMGECLKAVEPKKRVQGR